MNAPDRNITWHESLVTSTEREALLEQRGCVVWLTGLSGSGKSTIARALERRLLAYRYLVYVLDGDNVRHGLNYDLGFSPEDRKENIRRIGEVATLFVDAGIITVVAFISPYRTDRWLARAAAPAGRFFEVFIDAPLGVCEVRDPKGLYRKARLGEIGQFTGVSAPYEKPESPELVVNTAEGDVSESVETIMAHLRKTGVLSAPSVYTPIRPVYRSRAIPTDRSTP